MGAFLEAICDCFCQRPFWAMWRLRGQTTEFHMHEYLSFLPIASYSTAWFHLSDCLEISISILVFQLANVTSVRRNKCRIALCPHGRIWEVLEGQGDQPVLCSFNPKSCMKTAVDALTWSIHSCTMYSRCIQLKFCNKLKHISKLFFNPNLLLLIYL